MLMAIVLLAVSPQVIDRSASVVRAPDAQVSVARSDATRSRLLTIQSQLRALSARAPSLHDQPKFKKADDSVTRALASLQPEGPSMRGLGLVQASTLRAAADSVLELVDQLPEMLAYTPASGSGLEESRERIRSALDDLTGQNDDGKSDTGRRRR